MNPSALVAAEVVDAVDVESSSLAWISGLAT